MNYKEPLIISVLRKAITISRRGAERARSGHLWIYRSDIRNVGAPSPGAVEEVFDERGRFIGQALYSDRSEIALRFLTYRRQNIDREWWRQRIKQASRRRINLVSDAEAHRLIYSEGDLLPSLIVDRYRDVLVLQTLSQGTERLKEMLTELLVEEFGPSAVIERNDVRVRELEGLDLESGLLYGDCAEEDIVRQHGVLFLVAPLTGQKTGAFLDQRENHVAARQYAHGRALDCFTFQGGFALNIANTCESVLGLDISRSAIDAAQRNALLNHLKNVQFEEANVFDFQRQSEARGISFDTIILDPPAFAKSRSSLEGGARGYKEINLRALKMLSKGGILISCSCSYHISESMFLELIAQAAADARRQVQIVEKRTQARDHPVLLGVPETLYLKCVVARVIE